MSGRLGSLIALSAAGAVVAASLVALQDPLAASALPAGPADAKLAATAGQALQIAEAYDHPVVVDSLTTETTQTSALPDGTMEYAASTVPLRVKTDAGWVPVDTSLTADGSGALVPAASDNPVKFSDGGAGPLAQVQTPSGSWVSESSPFGSLPAPTVSGSSATYSEVLPGVDLVATATVTGMSEVLRVKTPEAAANPELDAVSFQVSGAALTTDSVGSTVAKGSDGSTVKAGSPTWWDSSQGSTADGPAGTVQPMPVSQTVAGHEVTIDASPTPAAAVSVQYPLYVDPDWNGGLNAYWYIDTAYPDQSYLNNSTYAAGVERMGFVDAAHSPEDHVKHLARNFYLVNTSGVEGKHITNAYFAATVSGAFNCSVPRLVDFWWVGAMTSGATWNQSSGGQYLSQLDTETPNGCTSQSFTATSAVAAAAAANAASLTVGFRAHDETDNYGWKKWAQAGTMYIRYNTVPNAPSNLTLTSPSVACGTSAASAPSVDGGEPVSVSAYQSDADPGDSLTTTFTVTSATNQQWSYSASPQASGINVGVQFNTSTPPILAGGGVFKITATTSDGTDGSATSSSCFFNSITTSPGVPNVTVSGAAATTVGAPFSVTMSALASDQVKLFAYWWVPTGSTTPIDPAATATAVTPTTQQGVPSVLTACPSIQGKVHYVCPAAGASSATVTVDAPDKMSTLWVASYNAAGRVSKNSSGSNAAGYLSATYGSDTTNITYAVGHGWWLSQQSSVTWGGTIPDQNTSTTGTTTAGQALQLFQPGATDTPGNRGTKPVAKYLGYTSFTQWANAAQTIGASTVEGAAPPTGDTEIMTEGILPTTSMLSGQIPLYTCTFSGGTTMSATTSNCDGRGATAGLDGYLYPSSSAVTADGHTGWPLYRCRYGSTNQYVDLVYPAYNGGTCGISGWNVDTQLGWAATMDPGGTDTPVVDSTKSYSVTLFAKLAGPSGHAGSIANGMRTPTTAWAFDLRQTSDGKVQFCVRSVITPTLIDCATSPAVVPTGYWHQFTGIWDAASDEVRLVIDKDLTAAAVTGHIPPTGETAGTGPLLIGSSYGDQGQEMEQFDGSVGDISIFPGVIDQPELVSLSGYTDPSGV